ncbi:MAG: multiheme c-type cytochrome [Pseudomonadota bacterium]
MTAIPLVLLILWHSWRFSLIKKVLTAFGLVSGLALFIALSNPMVGAIADDAANPKSAVSSTSLLMSSDKSVLYSANFESGSISKVDKKTGKRLAETPLGGDIRTVALNHDESLVAVTDHGGESFYILDAKTLKLKVEANVPGRPYGVLYDARNKLFWVTADEAHKLYGIDEDGAIRQTLGVADTPRGLALMPDGRLIITHAMIGEVSIYDTTQPTPKLSKTIKLHISSNPDITKSQGLPRVLDRIVLSPDLKQAWLPHHLWNFDHPFQFQSIVFPAISLLWMEKGNEHEVVNRRKQLFVQINIIESGNIQRIVSNPYDAVFSEDGTKVYAVMAGSEDLVTFDLTRAAPVTGDEGANGSTGANASQVFQLPGENPRGITIDGENLYVQNAMSLDLSTISTGGGGPFSQMAVSNKSFAKLVGTDPLEPKMRRGLRLFHLARTSAFPNSPMSGRGWMSCASCHLSGFNFTNGALFRATTLDITKDAVAGHFSLKDFIAGDIVAEYIRMIKQTQGGMGFDTKFDAPDIDPENPPADVAQMMLDLHHYVTSDHNLPLLSTWLRADGGTGSVDHTKWVNPAVCRNCHTKIFDEWSGSMHRLMGESNPYYVVVEDLAAKEVGEPFRAWCMGCHAPQALLSGARKTEGTSHLFEKDGASLVAELKEHVYAVDEGTGCLFCHRTQKVEMIGPVAGGNASLEINLADRVTYPGEDSSVRLVRWLANRSIRAEPEEHRNSYTPEVLTSMEFCSSCHEEFTPGVASQTTSTYSEWANSHYNNKENPAASVTCNDCHMHTSVAQIGTPVPGVDTNEGPIVADYKAHHFVGAQYHLLGLRSPQMRQMTIDLLKTAASLATSVKAGEKGGEELVVRVSNVGAGHNLPTGVSDFRQLWLDVTVSDADGKQVLTSGKLDSGGHLDPKARIFANVFGDGTGHHLGLDFWKYREMLEDTRIPAGGFRDEVFELPDNAKTPLQVDVKLMFRTFPQAITDEVRKRFPDMPAPDAVELQRMTTTLGST